MPELAVRGITVAAGGAEILRDASFTLGPGELVALLGPNGAGKTTLLRASLGLLRPASGSATLDGRSLARLPAAERARGISYLPQERPLAWPNSVRDIVALGRFSHGVAPGHLAGADAAAVERALASAGLGPLAARPTDTLSGGETARVHCARAFAAEAPLLLADEPVAALDLLHQFRVMGLIRDYVDAGGGALAVLHDVALAARFADRLLWMKDGAITADGPPAETLDRARIESVYGVRARVEGRRVEIEGPV